MVMVDDKPPRLDDFLCEFFKASWDVMGSTFLGFIRKKSKIKCLVLLSIEVLPSLSQNRGSLKGLLVGFQELLYNILAKSLELWL
jgi:hypothetical protein